MATTNFADALANAVDVNSPVPDGVYDVVVTKAAAGTSKKGDIQFTLGMRVLHGEQANRPFTIWLTLTDNPVAQSFFFEKLAALGCPKEYMATNPPPEQVAQRMLNLQVRVTIQNQVGSTFTNVNKIEPTQTSPAAAPVATAAPAPAVAPAVAPAPVAAAPAVAPAPVAAPAAAPAPAPAPAVAPAPPATPF